MSESITLGFPDELARRARALAAQTHRPFEQALIEWIDRAVAEPAVELLPDDQLLALSDSQLGDNQQAELNALLARNREGPLSETECARLEELMHIYRRGLVRKAQALKVAVARGLRPRLS
jgi:hypothetical protein